LRFLSLGFEEHFVHISTVANLPNIPQDLPTNVDGYALHNALRNQSPLALGPFGVFYALRYKHFELITSQKTRQVEDEFLVAADITSGPLHEAVANGVLFSNGDVHIKRRAPMARTFAFKLMDSMRPRIADMVSEIVTQNLGKGPIDFLERVAGYLPARIIADILGVPHEDLPTFLSFIPLASESLGPFEASRRQVIEENTLAFGTYIDELVKIRRKTPREDFLTALIGESGGGGLTDGEIREQIAALILAGSDTTRGTLCMTLSTLLQHPDQWAQFCADPDGLKRGAVQEGLRFEPVVEGIPRIALEDIEFDSVTVPKDAMIIFCTVSALRDPQVYAEPDNFNIHRTDHPKWHPIFGAGAHRCLGEALARAELEEALAAIAKLAPNTKLIGDPPKLSHLGLRQVDQMQVAFA
jgi:cytochrome P450 family 103